MASRDRAVAKAYPTDEQYERWKARADDLDMSISEFVQAMVEAGIKVDRGFELSNQRDETVSELREQRRKLKRERDEARKELEKARDKLADREREAVHNAIVSAPDEIGFDGVVEHVRATAPERVADHLDALEGNESGSGGTIYRNSNTGDWFAVGGES